MKSTWGSLSRLKWHTLYNHPLLLKKYEDNNILLNRKMLKVKIIFRTDKFRFNEKCKYMYTVCYSVFISSVSKYFVRIKIPLHD